MKKRNNIRLTIGDFSKYCQVTVKRLRHYEKIGLLVPNEVDEWTGYRYYDLSQMQQMNGILRLQQMGFTLEEIRELLDEGTHRPSIPQIVIKTRETEEQIQKLLQRLDVLRRTGDAIRQIADMEKFAIQRLPSIIVASYRCRIHSYNELTSLCANVVGPEIQRIGCKRTQPMYSFSIDYGEEFMEKDADIEYCEQVEEMYEDTPLIKFKRLPEVPMAVCMKCDGPYGTMRDNFIELFNYITSNNYQVTGKPRLQYVEGPWNQMDPAKWLTIIQIPVDKLPSENSNKKPKDG
ncbi:MAG: MerR family transcriptional regulator [Muribaculaceae bacterium]|nr:MerR family transcriptional regulator [Muribaculaceae bacterium]